MCFIDQPRGRVTFLLLRRPRQRRGSGHNGREADTKNHNCIYFTFLAPHCTSLGGSKQWKCKYKCKSKPNVKMCSTVNIARPTKITWDGVHGTSGRTEHNASLKQSQSQGQAVRPAKYGNAVTDASPLVLILFVSIRLEPPKYQYLAERFVEDCPRCGDPSRDGAIGVLSCDNNNEL